MLGAVADVLLLHHPSYSWLDGSADGTYAPLRHIPLERVLLGHLLGLSRIPLGEAAGTYLIYDLLKPAFGARTATASVAIGAYLIALGTAYHACLFPLAHAVQQLDQKAVAAFRSFSEPRCCGIPGPVICSC